MMDSYLVKSEAALLYECGYACDNALLINHKGRKFFITDGRYTIEANELIKGASVIEAQDLAAAARLLIRKLDIKRIFFDPFELDFATFNSLTRDLRVDFRPQVRLSQEMRIVKSASEIEHLRAAHKMGADGFDELARFIARTPGLVESDINFQMKLILQNGGKTDLSFAPITAVNANAAKAHALPSGALLKDGDLILVDAGLRLNGWCSDRTRTTIYNESLNMSKKQHFNDAKKDEVYNIVLAAQEAAIKAARPGVMACEVDAAARDFITKAGYGAFFTHSTGHGVGLDIHELPVINAKSRTILKEGMVFSIEPGIYLAGEFGVRIEDVVALTKDGCEIL